MAIFVISQTHLFQPPTAQYCKQIQAQYGLTMPVLYDPSGALKSTFGWSSVNDQSVVWTLGGELVFKSKYANQNTVDTILEDLLTE